MSAWRKAYERLGLLFWLGLFALIAGIALQSLTRLPGAYTWFDPLLALRFMFRSPHFPIALCASYACGAWVWRGQWNLDAAAQAIVQPRDFRASSRRLVRPLTWMVAVIFVDRVALHSERDLADQVALLAIGAGLARYRPSRAQFLQDAAYAGLGLAVFQAVCYCYTASKALSLVHGRHYDSSIIALELALFGVAPHRVLGPWAARHQTLLEWLDWSYVHLLEHMALCTVLLVALRKRTLRTEYLAALALCYLIGGAAYHLFPTLGPSYYEPRYFPALEQRWLFSGSLRRVLKINTDRVIDGSARTLRTWAYVAAMPSLHAAQELIIVYYTRSSWPAFASSLMFGGLTLLSVLALGWHYSLDLIAGAVLALVSVLIAQGQRRSLLPQWFTAADGPEPPPPKPIVVPFVRAYLRARRARAARSA